MTVLERLLDYFASDPLKLLTLLGGSGGLAFWLTLIRGRVRIRVKILEEKFYNPSDTTAGLRAEVVNLGKEPTSLEPNIVMHGYTPKGQARRFVFEIRTPDRHLTSHAPKVIDAECRYEAILPFLYFKSYRFVPTRGRPRRVFIRSAAGNELGTFRFLLELARFKVFRTVVREHIQHEGPV